MGCTHHLAIFLLILVISTTSHLRLFNAQGRKLAQTPLNSKVSSTITLSHSLTSSFPAMKEEKTRWRVQIGSTPPRCERRCDSCGHCEAIQVPTNPHTKNSNPSSELSVVMDGRDYGNSNYKPMSWKCKCGNLFFNP